MKNKNGILAFDDGVGMIIETIRIDKITIEKSNTNN